MTTFAESPLHRKGLLEAARAGRVPTSPNGAKRLSQRAQEEARGALGEYWKALQGTLDPEKVEKAATNALIGNAEEVAAQIPERFHPEDRLMLWFDFFNHDSDRVIRNMEKFMSRVEPLVAKGLQS